MAELQAVDAGEQAAYRPRMAIRAQCGYGCGLNYGGSMPRSGECIRLKRRFRGTRPCAAGFTLIELMVTLAVAGILAAIAVPSMTAMLNANRLSGATGELTAALQLARAEAIRRNTRVTVCASANGLTCTNSGNWARWIIHGADNSDGADEVIRDQRPSGSVQISGPPAGIVFRPSGIIDAQTTVTACVPVSNPSNNQKVITVMISGTLATTSRNGGGACA
ncbi:GspH/FimT family pseudopilin [Luteimonas notoginsengisoli]|uniref:Type II secretion system protein H n=1 Tax=Luteimonas notoginsengisoli TaxID=1578200 RepID=A0ABV7URU8_9GAMM